MSSSQDRNSDSSIDDDQDSQRREPSKASTDDNLSNQETDSVENKVNLAY